ncbi:MAG: precorrin-2 dehydrogenase/sirohydrochlorin ferrochelatase family protein, partial [Acidimicrobiales bacterium]
MVPPSRLYPVALDLRHRPCLVVGGGRVATRKAAGLVGAGAAVTLVAPRINPAIESLARTASADLCLERRRYRDGEAGAYQLVVSATGVPEIDRAVAEDAAAAGRFVNVADDPDHCSFLLPAVHRSGRVSVAVSTEGASPALAGWLRSRLAAACGAELGELAELL